MLTSLNGQVSLTEAVATAAGQLGIDRVELPEPAAAIARGLYQLGFLER